MKKTAIIILGAVLLVLLFIFLLLASYRKQSQRANDTSVKKLKTRATLESDERVHAVGAERKKLFFVNSYHKGYKWSDDLEKELLKTLSIKVNKNGSFDLSQSDVELRMFRMDTKRNTSEEFKQQAALSAKAIIDEWQPDIVIASDDNAVKYLIAPYYKNSSIPFVFCGVNWDASVYGLPVSNVTGIIEVHPLLETVKLLKKYSKGKHIGIITSNNTTALKNKAYGKEILAVNSSDIKLATTFDGWKKEYLNLQDTVDIVMWFSPIGIIGWDQRQAEEFILEHTRVPSGAISEHVAPYALISNVMTAEEQGGWAANTALEVLNGRDISTIPIARNRMAKIVLNMPLAKKLKIKFPVELIERSHLISAH